MDVERDHRKGPWKSTKQTEFFWGGGQDKFCTTGFTCMCAFSKHRAIVSANISVIHVANQVDRMTALDVDNHHIL